MSLIEKLERELVRNCHLNNWDLGFQAAIDNDGRLKQIAAYHGGFFVSMKNTF